MFDNNTSGQSGISKIANQVNGKKYLYWRLQWSDDSGKRKCKNFPRTGEGMARAIEFRDHLCSSIKSDDSIVARIAATTAVAEVLSGTGLDLSLDLSRSIMATPAPPLAPSGKCVSEFHGSIGISLWRGTAGQQIRHIGLTTTDPERTPAEALRRFDVCRQRRGTNLMYFASDNSGPVHPHILQALTQANTGYAMSYGADTQMETLRDTLREVFEAPEAAVYLVATGTAANALALATLSQPYQTVFCSDVAHIHEDECNAPEFYSGGAKLTLVPCGNKMTAQGLRKAIETEETRGVHGPQRGPVAISQVTERGSVYSLEELRALTAVAAEFGLPVHLDGARFANAMVALDCTAAEMSWKAGVDVVSFGGTKNGCMGVEAVIFFDPKHAWEFELRRKRGAHLFSKNRYLAAQMLAYLQQDLWLDNAQRANGNSAYLAEGLRQAGAEFLHRPEANMIFASLPRASHQRAFDAGASYHLWDAPLQGPGDERIGARFVCDWSISREQIDQFLALI